ncbi:MAG: hypothetical protein JO131_01800, partial [Gammaproteobacteria bacterium]|nr:hypothetical protein [Gammaproteobacteria bacterium]
NYLNLRGKIIAEVGFTAARRLKRRYRRDSFQWLKYRKPNGKIAMLAMDCIFICEQNKLPCTLLQKNSKGFLFRLIDQVKDWF